MKSSCGRFGFWHPETPKEVNFWRPRRKLTLGTPSLDSGVKLTFDTPSQDSGVKLMFGNPSQGYGMVPSQSSGVVPTAFQ